MIYPYLKRFFLLTIITTCSFYQVAAQKKLDYDSAWKKMEYFSEKGLPKSALETVKNIYIQAKADGQQAQQIKAIVVQSRLVMQVEENEWVKNVNALESEIAATTEPVKQILESITASLYYGYFQNQRYRIYNRTNTVNFKKDDPETWTIADFHRKISALYEGSLQNSPLLQSTKLDPFDPILTIGNTRKLRPTLFDLLAWQALQYFQSDEQNINQPAYAFVLKDDAAVSDASTFMQYDYQSKDSSSLQLKAIKIFQQILAFHKNDVDKAAFIDADINRLDYTYDKSVSSRKEELYKATLEQIFQSNQQVPEAMQAGYLLARWWNAKGEKYKNGLGNEADKYAIRQAATICQSIKTLFPDSEGGINANNLLNAIKKPALYMKMEKVNVVDQPMRSLIQFKNINNIYLRIVRITDDMQKILDNHDYYSNERYWQKLVSFSPKKSWQQQLPKEDDFRQHSAEIKVDGLPFGKYALISSGDEKFSLEKNPLTVTFFYVSNISFVRNGTKCYVLDRDNGHPLEKAKVQIWYQKYDYKDRAYKQIKGPLKITDKNGFVKLPEDDQNRYSLFEITYNNDKLSLEDEIYVSETSSFYSYNTEVNEYKDLVGFEKINARYFFFTDRSIYRPGQWIYFKAIGVTKNKNTLTSKPYQPKDSIEITLKDANSQKVESMFLLPNEYGSVSGKFRIPENILNGQFTLNAPNNTTYSFRVEEYKRPKFYVDYEAVKGTYQLNDKVKITGTAKAYAGNNIDGAAVKYRVYRNTRFLYPWLLWRRGIWNYNPGRKMEITNGETTTDASGKFDISFEAIPDLSVNKELDPTFDYTIEADVTDINGETRSGTAAVTVAYKALQLSISIPGGSILTTDSLRKITIRSTNMNGAFESVKAKIRIHELVSSNRLLRNRYWDAPDTSGMTYNEFASHFPHDPYKQENDYRTWEKGKMLFSDTLTTVSNMPYTLQHVTFPPGWYIVEVTARDKNGQELNAIEYVQLYNNNKMPSMQYVWQHPIKTSGEPGDNAQFASGTSADNLFIIQETIQPKAGAATIENRSGISKIEYLNLNNKIEIASLPITEADRGSYAVNRFTVKHNRFYSSQWQVYVPWSNKNLDIQFETFRDKLLPGQQEQWKVRIKGYKGEQVAAEMLASMYDASLDQFASHYWNTLDVWPHYYFYNQWEAGLSFNGVESSERYIGDESYRSFYKTYDQLIDISSSYYGRYKNGYEIESLQGRASGVMISPSSPVPQAEAPAKKMDSDTKEKMSIASGNKNVLQDNVSPDKPQGAQEDLSNVHVRTNLQETAFFLPHLETDAEGNIAFSFTMPEALTKWKLQTLAHTRDLSSGIEIKTAVTQKDLMVQPSAPRFFREGDRMVLSAKISNLTEKELTGQAQLQLFNAATNQPIDMLFGNVNALSNFTVKGGQSTAVTFPLEIPKNYNSALTYRIIAKSGQVSDGEENAAPVLINRMLVTESIPLNVRNTNHKTFTFEKLLNSASSTTATSHALTVEYTTNPIWYAVQALPYLMEYPYECAEQTMNRFYANALATKIANNTPKIKAIFEQWKTQDTAALLSNLEKNQELKYALLEETPWVMDAQNESKQKKNIALLFDMVKMSKESGKAIAKMKELQTSNGGFMWFKGGPDDRYITQYILASIGHLRKLDAWPDKYKNELTRMAEKAVPYLDARIKEDYDWLIRNKIKLNQNNLSSIAIHYLYMRSFFMEHAVSSAAQKAVDYYTTQATKYWLENSKYEQGMIALALHRKADKKTPFSILKSLKENSITSEEFGMYWKEFNTGGYYWYQAPVESHALLTEAFSEIENNATITDNLKTWLLKQKQTQNWKTTKATAEACYALLLQGSNWLNVEKNVTIKLGDYTINSTDQHIKTEAGTGYFKQRIEGDKVKPNMGNITVDITDANRAHTEKTSSTTSWGGVYWQYFEDLDKITPAATPLSLMKKLFVEKNTDRGPVLQPVQDGEEVKIGDKIKVRIELRVDRNMEYVHMKDMRAACLEPINILSQYKYQDGLGYYESTKDASTNFFFSYLNKGTYVFEYPLTVTNSGDFSNGITTIQCMYAPEFTSHSEGIRLRVK